MSHCLTVRDFNVYVGGKRVYVKFVGTGCSKTKMILCNGGPGSTHNYLLSFVQPLAEYGGVDLYYYDQAGSYYSQPLDSLTDYTMEYYAFELEEVIGALGLTQDPCTKFYVFGHSFGGMIIMEWAARYSQSLAQKCTGIIISDMMSSIPEYNKYQQVLLGKMPFGVQEILRSDDYSSPLYTDTLNRYYNYVYLCQIVPYPCLLQVSINLMNAELYNYMQGPNELVITGTLKDWDRTAILETIPCPILFTSAVYDTMNPEFIQYMSTLPPHGFFYKTCGSHNSEFDDPKGYFSALLRFIRKM